MVWDGKIQGPHNREEEEEKLLTQKKGEAHTRCLAPIRGERPIKRIVIRKKKPERSGTRLTMIRITRGEDLRDWRRMISYPSQVKA